MRLVTPTSLEPVKLAGSVDQPVFVLCHPFFDGVQDDEVSIILSIVGTSSQVVGVFRSCVNGMEVHENTLCVVDDDNTLHLFAAGEWRSIEDSIGSPSSQLFKLRSISGALYGLTSEGTVHRWNGRGWESFSELDSAVVLYDLVWSPTVGLLVCGANGLIARCNRGLAERLTAATSSTITSLLPRADGSVVATGWNGTILVIRSDEVLPVETGRTSSLLTAVQWGDKTLVSADTEILQLNGESVEVFETAKAYRLAAFGTDLWKIGIRSVGYRNAEGWTIVPVDVEVDLE